jgi:WD40 repeat protein
LLVLATRKPVSALLINSDAAQKKRESNHGIHWGVNLFAASQDKDVHRFTVMLSRDEKEGSDWVVTVTGSASITGHTDHVRSVAMAPAAEGGEHYLGSASDDGTIKVWKMSTLTEQCVCEGHRDDVLSLSLDFYTPQKPIIVSGGKDRTVRVWGEGTSRASTPIVCLTTLHLPAVARCIVTTKPEEGETYGDVIVGCGDGYVRQWRYVKERKQEELQHTVAVEAPPKAGGRTAKRKGKKGKRRQTDSAMDVEESASTTTTTTTREWVEAKWALVKSVQVHRESIASIALVVVPPASEHHPHQEHQPHPSSLVVVSGANDGHIKLTHL